MIFDIFSKRMLESGTVLRAYSPVGTYWRENFNVPTAVFANESDLIFSACHFDARPHKGEYYSEADEPTLDELRLMAALVLPIGWNCGVLTIYPLGLSLGLKERVDLTKPGQVGRLSKILRSKLFSGENLSWDDGPYPLGSDRTPYHFRDGPSPIELQHRIYEAIDVADHLMMRGLSALIKGMMLSRQRLFGEQAHYCLYVALDASFQLILRRLSEAGVANPSSADAAALMEETFGEEPSGRGYFEDYYGDRIQTLHPQSRFGVLPYAPVSYSHFHGLYYGLREVYRWLILDDYIRLVDDL
jgi:hypothetical protein